MPKWLIITSTIIFNSYLWSCSNDDEAPPNVIAEFTSDVTIIDEGGIVNFTDLSTGNPTTWNWIFTGGIPETSTDQNPSVTYLTEGIYSVKLTVSDGITGSSKTESTYIQVNCPGNCEPQLIASTLLVNDITRTFDVRLPRRYESADNLPVIIDMHGFTSTKSEQRTISEFSDLADYNSIIMVWPQAYSTGENCVFPGISGYYWNDIGTDSALDIDFIEAIIDDIGQNYKVDLTSVYITGLSNGAFMTYTLACELSGKIAAITSVAGSMYSNKITTGCSPTRQIPVMEIHGTDDSVVLYNGSENCNGSIASIEELMSFWRSNAGCSSTFTEMAFEDINPRDGTTAKLITYANCDEKVKLLIIDGGGHNWPKSQFMTSNANSVTSPINQDFHTASVIWDFFQLHHLN